MKSLREIFDQHDKRLIHKYEHYIEIYEEYFSKYRNTNVSILEIGLSQGGSIDMWKEYFGPELTFYGVDINADNKSFEEPNVKIFIGSQSDKIFLNSIKSKISEVDILIDDGGHTMEQQVATFDVMFDHVKPGGIYLCEDVQTSYMKHFYGKYKGKNTFIEYSKGFIDQLHAWFSEDKSKFKIDSLTRNIKAIHYYTSMVFIEKEKMTEPVEVKKGKATIGFGGNIGYYETNMPLKDKITQNLKNIKNSLKSRK